MNLLIGGGFETYELVIFITDGEDEATIEGLPLGKKSTYDRGGENDCRIYNLMYDTEYKININDPDLEFSGITYYQIPGNTIVVGSIDESLINKEKGTFKITKDITQKTLMLIFHIVIIK